MAPRRLNFTYALKDRVITHISETERSAKCGCVCPACGEILVVKKGQKIICRKTPASAQPGGCSYQRILGVSDLTLPCHFNSSAIGFDRLCGV